MFLKIFLSHCELLEIIEVILGIPLKELLSGDLIDLKYKKKNLLIIRLDCHLGVIKKWRFPLDLPLRIQ